MPETGWYWLPAREGEKARWHPTFYDRERGRMWVAECNGQGRRPRPEDLMRPAVMPEPGDGFQPGSGPGPGSEDGEG